VGGGVAQVYASAGSLERFARDFAAAWAKTLELARFDTG
jgi:catalase (peroxidase I)